jgi:uncharacterized protein (TIGR02246 family)
MGECRAVGAPSAASQCFREDAGYCSWMSEREREIARGSFDAFNRRDAEGLVAITHPDAVWLPFRAQLEGQPYCGHAGIRQFMTDMYEDWSSFEVAVDDVRELNDRVLATGRINGVSRSSGVEVTGEAGFVFEFRDGLVVRVVSYSDPEEARREACS